MKKQEKASPGPWRIEGEARVRRVIKDADGRTVVIIESWTRAPDAHLIAASPQLRDALLVLVLTPATLAWLEANDPMALQQARAAIEAARENHGS